jgi:Uma2 family endonuclease
MATIPAITTAQQLLEAPGLGRCELIRGKLIMMTPAGFRHGRIVSTVNLLLGSFVREHGLGTVTGAETGFQIARDPDTVRAPDVGFIRADRIPETEPVGFFPGAPDLAVEVLSPSDRASEVLAKVEDWLDAGAHSVWVVDPDTRTASVYGIDRQAVLLHEGQELDAADVLGGFRVAVSELFG